MSGTVIRCSAAAQFLRPALAGLADPFLVHNVAAAAAVPERAIARHEQVMVLGDYDVDGVTSTALLVTVLRRFGLEPGFVVPRRSGDGYGLSRSAIERALEPGRPDLFVALDCGTNSHGEAAYLGSQGIDVIVIDHHRSRERRSGGASWSIPTSGGGRARAADAWRQLCTVGLVFKLMHGLLKRLRADNLPAASPQACDHSTWSPWAPWPTSFR